MTERIERMRGFLASQHLAGWLSWRPEELVLQLGHLSYWGLSVSLLLASGERILFAPELDPGDTVPEGVTLIRYPWGRMDCANPFEILQSLIDQELRRRGVKRNVIGTLRHAHRSSLPVMAAELPPFPPEAIEAISFGTVQKAAADAAFLSLYLHKTRDEIEKIRLTNRAALSGLDAWRAALQPGRTEAETAAAAETAVHALTGRTGIHHARAWAMVQSGPHTADGGRFNRSSGRHMEEGDLVFIEFVTCVNGYWSDLTRTVALGKASAEHEEVLSAVAEAQQAALQSMAPGVSAHTVDAAARAALARRGFAKNFTHATGHHTGFRYHDPGFAIAPGSSGRLEPGMIVTIEPGAYVPERHCGARLEDDVLLTPAGVEVLSSKETEVNP